MKAVGLTGPDFMPRRFDISEPIAAPDGVVVDVMAASVNDFDRAAVRGRHIGLRDQLDPVLFWDSAGLCQPRTDLDRWSGAPGFKFA
jgi:NADPH:quinone reductase-like Zn-dependent oxidoreductase